MGSDCYILLSIFGLSSAFDCEMAIVSSLCDIVAGGESLLLEEAIKLSMCSVCRQLTGTIGRGCSAAYCAA